MATTDSRTGFRLPWSTDQRQANESAEPTASAEAGEPTEYAASVVSDAPGEAIATTESGAPAAAAAGDAGSPQDTASATEAQLEPPTPEAEPTAGTETAAASVSPAPSPAAARKPNKFLADLTKAMQAAAESAREDSIARFAADAKAFVEQIHARSTEESADLRRTADIDINQIRDWSKAEIARIREETEERIADRRSRLERETETHAAQIEHEIERVQGRVADFEAEMARFFERLLAEDDPTRFAALAENLPEPPSFDVAEALAEAAAWTAPTEPSPVAAGTTGSARPAEATENVYVAGAAEPLTETAATDQVDPWAGTGWSAEAGPSDATTPDAPEASVDPDAAFAAIQAAAEAAEAVEAVEADAAGSGADGAGSGADPRFEMLGLDPDFAAAEAEAFAIDATAAEAEEIPPIGEEALAARLAGLMPTAEPEAAAETHVTRVVVVGLVSVASIASFKRHLGRLPGVLAVGVSSGPDGEFVFAVTHEVALTLGDSVPTIPGFQARVTDTGEGVINVTAHDPESDA